MTDQPATPHTTQFNVIADFADAEAARGAIMDLERAGVESGRISLLGIDQRRSGTTEGDAMWAKDEATTGRVGRRAALAAVAGALLGAAIGFGITAVFSEGQDGRLIIGAMGGAIVGSLLGGLWGGYSNVPASGEAFEETFDAGTTGGDTQLAVRTDDEAEYGRAVKALEGSGATKVTRLDGSGKRVAG